MSNQRIFGFTDAQVVYFVKSALQNKIVKANDNFYSKSSEVKEVRKYYSDLSHYDFFWGKTADGSGNIINKKKIALNADKLQDIVYCSAKKKKIYFESEKTADKNCNKIEIMLVSKDNCVEGNCTLGEIGSNYYLISNEYSDDKSGGKYCIEVKKLPADLGEYIDSVFNFHS